MNARGAALAQFIDVLSYVRKRELHVESLLRGAKAYQAQPLKVAGENVAGLLDRANCAAKEVIAGLIDRYLQVYTGFFRLPNDHTRPKQVDVASLAGARTACVLLKQIHARRGDTEVLKQFLCLI